MTPTNTYATVANVQSLIKSVSGAGITIGTASTPTTTDVENLLDRVAAEVDAVLRASGYATVPATGTNDKLLIGHYVTMKAAALTWYAGYGGFGDVPSRVERWEKDYDTFIQRIMDKKLFLVDQSPGTKIGVIYTQRYTGDDE